MRLLLALLLALAALAPACASETISAAETRPMPPTTRQVVLVLADDWTTSQATLQRYERGEAWVAVGDPVPVMIGRNGLGWGRGLHGAAPAEGPVKREGDGKAPAGVFRLSQVFAPSPEGLDLEAGLPFLEVTATLEGVDDPASAWYNRVVEPSRVERVDWKSSERMLIEPYRIGVVVDHNADPPVPGAGSCIFMHVWKGPDVPTSGCTAADEGAMREIAAWLRREASPVLVQLPRSEADRLRGPWGLP